MKNKVIQVQTAVNSEEEAKSLANALIREHLAACVQYFPISSIYRWKGQIEESKEYMILIKSLANKQKEIFSFIKREHTYELPEIIVTALDDVSLEYCTWIEEEIKKKK